MNAEDWNPPQEIKPDHDQTVQLTDKEQELFQKYVDQHRPRFEQEFEKDIPRHPYKVFMEIRKENGWYGGFTLDSQESLEYRALKYLKTQYKPKWKQLAKD